MIQPNYLLKVESNMLFTMLNDFTNFCLQTISSQVQVEQAIAKSSQQIIRETSPNLNFKAQNRFLKLQTLAT